MNDPDPQPGRPKQNDPRRQVTRGEFLQIFTAVMLPMFMAMIDQTLLATATPVVAAEFGNLYDTSWIATAYLLTSAVMIPVYGRLGDRLGRRDVLLVALAIYVLGSSLCAASGSMNQLIAGRALQGFGGGGLMSLSFALIGELVPPRQRVSYQGYFAIIGTTANILGPVVGGQIVAHASWRWLFVASLPLGALAAWRLGRLPRGRHNPDAPGVADLVGLALFAVGTSLLLFGLSSAGHRFAWLSWQTAACLGVGALTWGALLMHEHRHRAPFFPIDLLQIRGLARSLLNAICSTFCLLALVFYLPVYFQLGLHTGAAQAGLLLMPVLLGFVTGGTLAGRYVGRTGEPKPVPVAGMTLAAIALLALVVAPPHKVLVATLGFVAGLGLGPTMPTVQVVVQTLAGHERLGAATALVVLSRTVGAALGTAVIGAVIYGLMPHVDLVQLLRQAGAANAPGNAEVIRAFHIAFLVAALVAAFGALNASRVPRTRV